jgi:ABC-type uncharacterized transport system YnjBCD ATPase subunit
LSNLGNALRALFERTGDTSVLNEAAEVTRLAVAATGDDGPAKSILLSNLVGILQRQFERTGDTTVLEEEAMSADAQ